MVITAELSLYPLAEEYEQAIIQFIRELKKDTELEVMTHAMSTYVKGESELVMDRLDKAMKSVDNQSITFSLVIKLINRSLPMEAGYLNF